VEGPILLSQQDLPVLSVLQSSHCPSGRAGGAAGWRKDMDPKGLPTGDPVPPLPALPSRLLTAE
jgi:hypothetical protein